MLLKLIANIGDRFGRLTVVNPQVHIRDRFNHNIIYCLVRCECGNELKVLKRNLFSGNTISCGCFRSETTGAKSYRHGGSHKRLYHMWCALRSRCYCVTNRKYPDYGGRGITVCDVWNTSFPPFRDWALMNGYSDDLSIDRMDVNGNYEPSNCRFIPIPDQMKNMRKTVRLTCFGETKIAADWCRDPRCVVGISTLTRRKRAGWSDYDALTLSPNTHNRPLCR
jgi:hypothetical protein